MGQVELAEKELWERSLSFNELEVTPQPERCYICSVITSHHVLSTHID